ncbi:MAG TPA: carbohydrate ABC transporter permease [Caldilineaceae bacterium]|nr:carbohydrate ABC transporter permease [Caldilineaceae bacterium]
MAAPALSYRAQRRIGRVLFFAALLIYLIWVLFPFYWMIVTSLRPDREMYSKETTLWPQTVILDHYATEIDRYQFLQRLGNSVLVASVTTLLTVVVSSLGAFSITRLRYPGRGALARSILLVYLIPSSLLFIPLYIIMYRVGLDNTRFSLIITYLTFSVPFCTWMLMGYFRGIPPDMEEAALIDGCTRLQSFYKILLPLAGPGLVAAGIFSFTLAWNEFLYALVFITSSQLQTVPVGLAAHIVADIYMWGPLMAGATMAAVPVVILYIVAQRALVQGLFAGSVRG